MFKPYYLAYLVIIGAGFIAGLFRFRFAKAYAITTILLGVTLANEISSKILAYAIKNNSVIYHFFQPLQTVLWAAFFYIAIRSKIKSTVIPVCIALLVFAALNTIFWQDLKTFPGNYVKFECVALLFWSIHLFFELLDEPVGKNIFTDGTFIICVAVLWFNLVSYIFFELFNYYIDHKMPTALIRQVHLFSNYGYYSLLLLAMLLKPSNKSHGY